MVQVTNVCSRGRGKSFSRILSALGEDGVSRAIALGDWTSVKSAKGIGPKTAQRVVNELKDKAAHVMSLVPHKVGNQEEKVSDADIIERMMTIPLLIWRYQITRRRLMPYQPYKTLAIPQAMQLQL